MQTFLPYGLVLVLVSLFNPGLPGAATHSDSMTGPETDMFELFDGIREQRDRGEFSEFVAGQYEKLATHLGFSSRERTTSLQRAVLYEKLGDLYAWGDKPQNALYWYSRGMGIYDELGETAPVSLLVSASDAKYSEGRLHDALDVLYRAFPVMEEQSKHQYAPAMYYRIGRLLCELERFEEAVRILHTALYLDGRLGDGPEWNKPLFVLGLAYQQSGMPSDAVNAWNDGLDRVVPGEAPDWSVLFRLYLGSAFIGTGQYREANTHLQTAESLLIEHNGIYLRRQTYLLIAEMFENQGLHDDAITYLSHYRTLNDSIFAMETEHQIEDLYLAYEMERIEGEIAALNKDQVLQREQIRFQRILIWMVALGLLIVAGFGFLFFNQAQRQRRTNMDLVARNLEIVENEKKDLDRIRQIESSLGKHGRRLAILRETILPRISALKLEAEVLQKDGVLGDSNDVSSHIIYYGEQVENLLGNGTPVTHPGTPSGREESADPFDEPDREKSALVSAIMDVLENSTAFMEEGFTLEKLAALVDSNKKDVSAAINEELGQGFNSLINKYRIRQARKMLSGTQYQQYTIEAIAQEVGFKSKSSFNLYFKKHTGLTPSFYKKTIMHASYVARDAAKNRGG